SLEQKSTCLLLTIADNGPGIPEHERERVFEPFVRLDDSRTTSGSGLGLSLVAAVVKLHDAKIILKDNNPGLRVDILLPI
ncbi:MAG TPA: ATP-binding protein, partial [Alphaproteobacteria bacterium]|nr:ATP-binding protein [Alphaproteobacteria bacterium]